MSSGIQTMPAAGDNDVESLRKAGDLHVSFKLRVALLTGGQDKSYALGLTSTLISRGALVDYIGSDDVKSPELLKHGSIRFLNLRGEQNPKANSFRKAARVLRYYARLVCYAATAKPKIFHILWNEKLELLDRTLLMLYYRMLGKQVVLTVHNVNARKRDLRDSSINRLSLRVQYLLAQHLFVHTQKMKQELIEDFVVPSQRISVIPLGINDTVPDTALTRAQAKDKLGIDSQKKALLFFGRITPYKGTEFLIEALGKLVSKDTNYRLIIAGAIKKCDQYWQHIQDTIERTGTRSHIVQKIAFIPDEETELYFKAADVLVLPYTDIFQSGVLVLGYNFGLPIIVTDVGALGEDVVPGKTGYVCRAKDSDDLARAIETYFASDLYRHVEENKQAIQNFGRERFSWEKVGEITCSVYQRLGNRSKQAQQVAQ